MKHDRLVFTQFNLLLTVSFMNGTVRVIQAASHDCYEVKMPHLSRKLDTEHVRKSYRYIYVIFSRCLSQ